MIRWYLFVYFFIPLVKCHLNESDNDSTPHKEIELLIRNYRSILLSYNITLLTQPMKWRIIQNMKFYLLKKSIRSWFIIRIQLVFSRSVILAFPFLMPKTFIKANTLALQKFSHLQKYLTIMKMKEKLQAVSKNFLSHSSTNFCRHEG